MSKIDKLDKIDRELKELFFSKKDKLSDEEVNKYMKIGKKIIKLFKKDLKKATINYNKGVKCM